MSYNKGSVLPYNGDLLFATARGKYVELARRFFGAELSTALSRLGRSSPNPWKSGSKDGLTLKSDFNQTGKLYFNSDIWNCKKGDEPIHLFKLMKLTGKSLSSFQTMQMWAEVLGVPRQDGKDVYTVADSAELAKAVAQMESKRLAFEARTLKKEQEQSAKARQNNQKLWSESEPLFLDGVPNPRAKEIFAYFRNRGIELDRFYPDSLLNFRFHPLLEYRDDGNIGHFDALISRIQSHDGKTVTLHRTYVKDGQKAPVATAKKMMPADHFASTSKSRCIAVGQPNGILGVAEGIETALSCVCAWNIPVWPCATAGNLKAFIPPKGVHTVVIFADKDASLTGQKAAEVLRERLLKMHIHAYVLLPKTPVTNEHGVDWNDVWKTEGKQGFPDVNHALTVMKNIRFKG